MPEAKEFRFTERPPVVDNYATHKHPKVCGLARYSPIATRLKGAS